MAEIFRFPYSASRRVHSQKSRRSKNGTPEERAAKAAAARGEPATLLDMCPQIDRRKLRSSPSPDQIATISVAELVVGEMCPAELKGEPLSEKAAVLFLSSILFQSSSADALQEIELKREVAGTSKIVGVTSQNENLKRRLGQRQRRQVDAVSASSALQSARTAG